MYIYNYMHAHERELAIPYIVIVLSGIGIVLSKNSLMIVLIASIIIIENINSYK